MNLREFDEISEQVASGLSTFLPSAAHGVKRADFPWGSIYMVGNVVRIDIKVLNQSHKEARHGSEQGL